MPDKLIEEGLKQPNQINMSFEKRAKEITSHVMLDQAQFGAEYFLAHMLPNFKSKILTQLLDTQKNDGPLLFSLLGQCFQDIDLPKWTSIIAKQCPNDADHMKSNIGKCIRDYREAVAGFPNIGNQLLSFANTTKPLQRHNGLVVLANVNKSAVPRIHGWTGKHLFWLCPIYPAHPPPLPKLATLANCKMRWEVLRRTLLISW